MCLSPSGVTDMPWLREGEKRWKVCDSSVTLSAFGCRHLLATQATFREDAGASSLSEQFGSLQPFQKDSTRIRLKGFGPFKSVPEHLARMPAKRHPGAERTTKLADACCFQRCRDQWKIMGDSLCFETEEALYFSGTRSMQRGVS